MIAKYMQRGESIDYVPSVNVSAGDLIILNDLVAVAKLDIPAGTLGAVSVGGVYETPKDSAAIPMGKKVYWDNTNKVVTATVGSNTLIGKAVNGTIAADGFIRVLLNG